MSRVALMCMLFGLLIAVRARSQSAAQPATKGYTYHAPDKDKESWQRLNLLLSSTFIIVTKEGHDSHDNCLYTASRSLGLSRFPVLAEGIGGRELFEQSKWIDQQDPDIGIGLLSKATGRKHLQLLILLGSFYAFQPGSSNYYKNSVEYFLNKAVDESKTSKEERLGRIALCLLGKIYVQVNDDKGDSIYNLLINQCRKAGDKETEARAFAYRGIYTAPTQATFQKKITDLQTASDLYHHLGNTEGEINVLTDLGYMLVVTGQLQTAKEVFLKALALAEAINYPYIHYNTEALAMVTMFQGKFGEPLRYTLQTIRLAESSRDSIGWGYFYSRLSNLYYSEGRQYESFTMAQKAIKRFIKDRNPTLYNALHEVVNYMNEQGHAAEALNLVLDISKKVGIPSNISEQIFYYYTLSTSYLYTGNLDLAEMYVKKVDSLETLAEAVRGPLRRIVVNNQLGFIYFKRGQYKKAREYFEKSFSNIPLTDRNLSYYLDACRWLISIDSALGDKVSAASHYEKYTELLDSSFKVTKIRQAEELQVIYETQEKENHIAALNQQAKQNRLIKNLTLAGIAVVVIIAGLLYRQNRLKQKSNKIITDKNEQLKHLLVDKEWLLKETHHRVKNNLQIIMSLLDSQSRYIDNDAALTAINDSQRRVQAISLIHQKLYQSENTSSIDMTHYIDELVSYLQHSFDTGSRAVIEQYIEPVKLDVAKAIPLGLIINEAIVNAVKYAFPERQKSIVRISLKYSGPDHLLLNISDNGIGLPLDIKISKRGSLGFNLMRGLTRQLDGDFAIESNKGLHISIRFSALNNQSYE
jgi:two-component system, sensor histidine kinase PdtaS